MSERMSANEWKRKYRAGSGFPNVQEAHDRQQEANREKAMLDAGARVKRGPGRPPKASYDGGDE